MALEIERKFLVKSNDWQQLAKGVHYRQGYLNTDKERTVRVRTIDDKGILTIKGISVGATRLEYEYEIPVAEALEMLEQLCEKPIIDKHRYKITIGQLVWEIDQFHGQNEGLIVAEIELESEYQVIEIPNWIGEEVTGEVQYYNSSLVRKPFLEW